MFYPYHTQEQIKAVYERRKVEPSYYRRAYEILCPVCGETFYTYNRAMVYCSYDCKKRACSQRQAQRRKMESGRVCLLCGACFMAKRGDAKYCSAACRQRAYRNSVTVKHSLSAEDRYSRNAGESAASMAVTL